MLKSGKPRPRSTVLPAIATPKIKTSEDRVRPCTACNDIRFLDLTKSPRLLSARIPNLSSSYYSSQSSTTGLEHYHKKGGGVIYKTEQILNGTKSRHKDKLEPCDPIRGGGRLYDVAISFNSDNVHLAVEIAKFLELEYLRVAMCKIPSNDENNNKNTSVDSGTENSYKIIQSRNYLQLQHGKYMLENIRFEEELCLAVEMGIAVIFAKSTPNGTDIHSLKFPMQLIVGQYKKTCIDLSDPNTRQRHVRVIAETILSNNEFPNKIRHSLRIKSICSIENRVNDQTPRYFWSNYIGNDKVVSWKTFFAHFFKHYAQNIDPISERDRIWLWSILRNQLISTDGNLTPSDLVKFCTEQNTILVPIWAKLCQLAAKLHVFATLINVDSSTREIFTTYFGRHIQTEKMALLILLTKDQNPNCRVAAILTLFELTKSQLDIGRTICEINPCLSDEDYFVRESTCRVASVSPLFVEKFRSKLMFLSRNDPVKRVREAAASALLATGSCEDTTRN